MAGRKPLLNSMQTKTALKRPSKLENVYLYIRLAETAIRGDYGCFWGCFVRVLSCFKQFRINQVQISRINQQIQGVEEEMWAGFKITSRLVESGRANHGISDPVGGRVAKLMDLIASLERKKSRLSAQNTFLRNFAIKSLSGLERQVIIARYFDGLPWSEVAQRLGVSLATVYRINKKYASREKTKKRPL